MVQVTAHRTFTNRKGVDCKRSVGPFAMGGGGASPPQCRQHGARPRGKGMWVPWAEGCTGGMWVVALPRRAGLWGHGPRPPLPLQVWTPGTMAHPAHGWYDSPSPPTRPHSRNEGPQRSHTNPPQPTPDLHIGGLCVSAIPLCDRVVGVYRGFGGGKVGVSPTGEPCCPRGPSLPALARLRTSSPSAHERGGVAGGGQRERP